LTANGLAKGGVRENNNIRDVNAIRTNSTCSENGGELKKDKCIERATVM
jgi:hypothetical protein